MKIHSLYIYPIKSLIGQKVNFVEILPSGALKMDRTWAIINSEGKIINGKKQPLLQKLNFTLIDINDINSIEEKLSNTLSLPITLINNLETGFPDDTYAPGPTWIGLSTLKEIAKWYNETWEQTARRFRTNIVVDGISSFEEDNWVNKRIQSNNIIYSITNVCNRCTVPSINLKTGTRNKNFINVFIDNRAKYVHKEYSFNHNYKIALNSKLLKGEGKQLKIGDELELIT